MKSICIKTNKQDEITYLLNMIDDLLLDNIYYTSKKFKHYKNIILHYAGGNLEDFISRISEILSCLVIDFHEKKILKRHIFSNYFYFDNDERKAVLDICLEVLAEGSMDSFENRYNMLFDSFNNYLLENDKLFLDGFINFRLKKYISFLDSVIDNSVNRFIVDREYWEFISLLKVYINSEVSSVECVHLIYGDEHSILLDEKNNLIDMETDCFKARYLSDISFSSNDYALNTLLNILPKKIYVHLSDAQIDEFINTLMLVFENRVEICQR